MGVNSTSPSCVISLSGGMDSAACLAWAVDEFGIDNVYTVAFTYGQKHDVEVKQARKIAKYYGVDFKLLDVSKVFEFSNCSLLKHSTDEIKHESYEQQIEESETGVVDSYVPFRNGLFLSIISSYAIAKGAKYVVCGMHADDSVKAAGKVASAYPDTSVEFTDAMARAIYLGSGEQVEVVAPLVNFNKSQVLKFGLKGKYKPFPYWLTTSCYDVEKHEDGRYYPCNSCGTCQDRIKAFEDNGLKDPIMEYGFDPDSDDLTNPAEK